MTEEQIHTRVSVLEHTVERIEEAVSSIAHSLQALTSLEAHHVDTREAIQRAFEEIESNRREHETSCKEMDKRVNLIESQLPILKMTSSWVRMGAIGIMALVGVSLIHLVIK